MVVLGSFFLLAAPGILITKLDESQTMTAVVWGWVDTAEVHGRSKQRYCHVVFSYTVDGQQFRKETKESGSCGDVVAQSARRVYYDPATPVQARLLHPDDWRGAYAGAGLTFLMGAVFLTAGLIRDDGSFRSKKRKGRGA